MSLDNVEEFCLQQKIEEMHDNKVIQSKFPKWDARILAASANLINEHFQQILGIDGASCIIPLPHAQENHPCPAASQCGD